MSLVGTSGHYKVTDNRPMFGVAVPRSLMSFQHEFMFYGLSVSVTFPAAHMVPSDPMYDEHNAWVPAALVSVPEGLGELWVPIHMVVSVSGNPSSIPPSFVASEEWTNLSTAGSPDPFESSNIRGVLVDVLDDAFEYWLRVVRWQVHSAVAGRELRARARSYPRLLDAVTGVEITGSGFTFNFEEPSVLDERTWLNVSSLLKQGEQPPLALEYYFDGIYQLGLGDVRRAVLDLAISVELHMKREVARLLPQELHPKLKREVTNLSAFKYRDTLFKAHLPNDLGPRYSSIKPALTSLAKARDDIMHRGTSDVTIRQANNFARAAEALLAIKATTQPK